MSNLSKRVQKSKSLKFNKVFSPKPNKIVYGTTSHNSEHFYQIVLEKSREHSPFGDEQIGHDTITVQCIQTHQPVGDCPGNSNGTVCYHGLGAVRYHLAQKDATVSFCQNIFDAIKLRKSGQSLVKIVSAQGQAVLWGVVGQKKYQLPHSLEREQAKVNLQIENYLVSANRWLADVQAMRGSKEEAEGID